MIRRRPWTVALVLVFHLIAGVGAARGQEETPAAADGTPGPASTTVPLFEVTLPADWRPAGAAHVAWNRETWEIGARLSIPAGAYGAGVDLAYIASGSIQLRVDGSLLVARAVSGGLQGPLQPAPAKKPVTLTEGDVAVFPTDAALHARNIGPNRALLLSAQIISASAPSAEQAAAGGSDIASESLGDIAAEDWANVPDGPLRVGLRRTLLPPGNTYGPYEVGAAAPELLAAEAGQMQVGIDSDGDGTPDSWFTVEGFMQPNDVLDGATMRAVRAGTESGPLVFLSLTFTPVGLQPTPTAPLATPAA